MTELTIHWGSFLWGMGAGMLILCIIFMIWGTFLAKKKGHLLPLINSKDAVTKNTWIRKNNE